ncbi:MAG: hypothetical protein ACK47B_21610 [Armatimonadota bacterium]
MPLQTERDTLLKQVVVRAVTAPPSLFLGTLGVLLLPGPAWPAGIAALLADAGWVWVRVRDPRFAHESSETRQRQRWQELIHRLENLAATLDPATAACLSAIVQAQERLLALYSAGSARVPHTRVELTSLLQHCLSLAEKRAALQTFVANFRVLEVQREAAELERKVDGCYDAVTRELFEQALRQKREELENFVRLQEAITRIDGQLAAVRCTFDNMIMKVIRLQAADIVADVEEDPVQDELHRLTRGVEALEASLNETLAVRGAG